MVYLVRSLIRFLRADDRPEARRITLGCLVVLLVAVVIAVLILKSSPAFGAELPDDPVELTEYRDRCISGAVSFGALSATAFTAAAIGTPWQGTQRDPDDDDMGIGAAFRVLVVGFWIGASASLFGTIVFADKARRADLALLELDGEVRISIQIQPGAVAIRW